MFPLGSVLLPSMVLPLHIFELRYRQMMDIVMASEDHSFGVVMIERGHEVGGEDQRSSVGTLARVLDTERSDDGRWGIVSVGVHRIQIEQWLPDDPYPRALVTDWADESVASTDQHDAYQKLLSQHRRFLGLSSEAGYDVGPIQDLSDDPTLGSFQIAATAPISNYDRHAILAADTLSERLPVIASVLESGLALIEMELGQALHEPTGDDD